MTVGVVLPVYNGADYVGAAMDSVLAQTYEDFDLVVVDDASTDATTDVVRGYDDPRVTLLENGRNRGVAACRNRGVDHVSRELVAFIDHDDIWHPEKLARHVEVHRATDADLVYSDIREVDADGTVLTDRPAPEPAASGPPLVRQMLFRGGSIIVTMSSVTVTRAAWTGVGGEDSGCRVSGDVDLYVRLAGDHAFERLPERLVDKRTHEDNISDDYRAIYTDHERILERALARYTFLDASDERRKRARIAYRRATSALAANESTEAVRFGLASLGHERRLRPLLVVLLATVDRLAGPFAPGHRFLVATERRSEQKQ